VNLLLQIAFNRLCTMLCMALTLVFAGVTLTSGFDHLQHAPGAVIAHQHLLFGNLSIDQDHIDDHHHMDDHDEDDGDGDQGTPDHLPGSHHHHGDNAPSLLASTADSVSVMRASAGRHDIEQQSPIVGRLVPGPERPPKAVRISV
jgi:hypothetical protein